MKCGHDRTAHRIVVIAASAGGIQALSELLAGLPAEFPIPILIVQHRGDGIDLLEGIFRSRTRLSVCKFAGDQIPTAGQVYFAPPRQHLVLDITGVLRLSDLPKVNFSRPAADLLFESAAAFYREGTIGIVLTGYGVDGSHGVEVIHQSGGYVMAQDPKTSNAPSMPNAAIKTGCVDVILPLHEIGPALLELVSAHAK